MSSTSSLLVLHADDLGMSRAVTDGILRGFREGLLTSTSLMANAPDAGRALERWKALAAEHASQGLPSTSKRAQLGDVGQPFDLGVHLNLTEGRPLLGTYPAEMLDAEGRFPGIFGLFARLRRHGRMCLDGVRAELTLQMQFVGEHGLQPKHLNGHQYIEMLPVVTEIVPELLERFGIHAVRVAREPALLRSTVLRGQILKWPLARVKRAFADRFAARMDRLGVSHPDVFFGTAHAGGIDLELLRCFLRHARSDWVEVGLHPAEPSEASSTDEANGWHDPLAASRPKELQMLISEELTAFLKSAGWRLGRLAP
jgi:predicted glycoside hydrolase/deacetylase ChbG (UPF0249 family)